MLFPSNPIAHRRQIKSPVSLSYSIIFHFFPPLLLSAAAGGALDMLANSSVGVSSLGCLDYRTN
jgi:hypothetical protein